MEVLFLARKEFMIIKRNSHMSVGVNCMKTLVDSSPLPKKSTSFHEKGHYVVQLGNSTYIDRSPNFHAMVYKSMQKY